MVVKKHEVVALYLFKNPQSRKVDVCRYLYRHDTGQEPTKENRNHGASWFCGSCRYTNHRYPAPNYFGGELANQNSKTALWEQNPDRTWSLTLLGVIKVAEAMKRNGLTEADIPL